jgi:hypothetical protein
MDKAKAEVVANPTSANVAKLVLSADTPHGRRHAPEIAALSAVSADPQQLKKNSLSLVNTMSHTADGERKNNTHLLAVTGALLENCSAGFKKQFAGEAMLSVSYIQKVITHTHTHTHTHTDTHHAHTRCTHRLRLA